MTTEPKIEQSFRNPREDVVIDDEGRDTGERTSIAPQRDPYDPEVGTNTGEKSIPAKFDEDGTPATESADKDNQPESNVSSIPFVQHERTQNGVSYFFVAPPQALQVGWEPSIHLGDDDGSGVGLGAINGKASQLLDQMQNEVKEYEEKLAAPIVEEPEIRARQSQQGQDVEDDVAERSAVVGASSGVNAEQDDAMAEYNRIEANMTQEQTTPDLDVEETDYSKMDTRVTEEDKDRQTLLLSEKIENDFEAAEAEQQPQSATPDEDAERPPLKNKLLTPVPPGEVLPEMELKLTPK